MNPIDFSAIPSEFEVTTKKSIEKIPSVKLFSDKPFVIVFQPGAGQTAASINIDKWMNLGLGGCTNEAKDYGDILDEYTKLGINVFIVNTMTPEEQQAIIKNKGFRSNLRFISDSNLDLAEMMGVVYLQINGKVVHTPIVGIYSKKGECLETMYPEQMGCNLAKRRTANDVLQICKDIFHSPWEQENLHHAKIEKFVHSAKR